MKVTVRYEKRSFGSDDDVRRYSATVKSHQATDRLELALSFNHAITRGGIYANSDLMGCHLAMSSADARRIATAILWHLENADLGPIAMQFDHEYTGKKSEP